MLSIATESTHRRFCPRVPVEELCTEHGDRGSQPALVIDLSEDGLRVQRPIGGPRSRALSLEFEIPGVDELVWARGQIRFDEVWQLPRPRAGVVRTSGIQVISASPRHRRMLREYVRDTWDVMQSLREEPEERAGMAASLEWCLRASCYLRG